MFYSPLRLLVPFANIGDTNTPEPDVKGRALRSEAEVSKRDPPKVVRSGFV